MSHLTEITALIEEELGEHEEKSPEFAVLYDILGRLNTLAMREKEAQ